MSQMMSVGTPTKVFLHAALLLLMSVAVFGSRDLQQLVTNLGIDTSGKLDIYLLADNTGSMSAEIADVRENAQTIFDRISQKASDVHWGVGAYRDVGDDFVFRNNLALRTLPVKKSARAANHPVLGAIGEWGARGGGDFPEAQLFALHAIATRINEIGWRQGANKILVWFGDAPGHDPVHHQGWRVTESMTIRALQDAGIQVLAIDVARLNDRGQAKRIAEQTNGRYTFIGRPQSGGGPPVKKSVPPSFGPVFAGSGGFGGIASAASAAPFAAAGRAVAAPGGSASAAERGVSDAIVEGVAGILDGP